MSNPHEFNAYMTFLAQRCIGPDSLPIAPAVREGSIILPEQLHQRLPLKPPKVCRQQPAELCRNVACATRAAGKKFTAQMREGPLGPGTLCNSCGIRWRRDVMRKEQELREKELKAEAMGVRLVRILPPDAPRLPAVAVIPDDTESEDESDAETLSTSQHSRRYETSQQNERAGAAGVSSAVASGTADWVRSRRVRAGAEEGGAGVSSSQESTEGVEQGAGGGGAAAASHSTTWQVHGHSRRHASQHEDLHDPAATLAAMHRQGVVKAEPSELSGLRTSTPAAGNVTLGLHHTSPHVTLGGLPAAMGLSPLAIMAAPTQPQLLSSGAWPSLATAVSLMTPAAQHVVQQVQLQHQIQLQQQVVAHQQLQQLQQQQLLLQMQLQQPASLFGHLAAAPQQLLTLPVPAAQAALLHPGVAVQLPTALHPVTSAVPSLLPAPVLLPTSTPQPYWASLALAGQQLPLPSAQLPK